MICCKMHKTQLQQRLQCTHSKIKIAERRSSQYFSIKLGKEQCTVFLKLRQSQTLHQNDKLSRILGPETWSYRLFRAMQNIQAEIAGGAGPALHTF